MKIFKYTQSRVNSTKSPRTHQPTSANCLCFASLDTCLSALCCFIFTSLQTEQNILGRWGGRWGRKGEGFSGTSIKDTWTKPKGEDEGWEVGMAGVGGIVGEK